MLANYKETQLTNVRKAIRRDHCGCLPGTGYQRPCRGDRSGQWFTICVLPPDNATGNFTKIVQRIPVKIVLDLTRMCANDCARECRLSRRSKPPAGLTVRIPRRGVSDEHLDHAQVTAAPRVRDSSPMSVPQSKPAIRPNVY